MAKTELKTYTAEHVCNTSKMYIRLYTVKVIFFLTVNFVK